MLRGIQSLRGVAALYVVIFHAAKKLDYMSAFTFTGRSGVDLFFIISGFIITYTTIYARRYSSGEFLTRRFVRIIPLYWIFTILLSLAMFFLPQMFMTYKFDFNHILLSLFFIPQHSLPVVNVGWTLVYEMYFYLAFALMLVVAKRKAPVVLIIYFILSYLIGCFFKDNTSPVLSLMTSELLIEFCIGVFFCYLYMKQLELSKVPTIFAIVLGFGLFYYLSEYSRLWSFGLPWAILFAGLIFGHLKILEYRATVFLGDASYSIYIVHPILLPVLHLFATKGGIYRADYDVLFVALYTLICVTFGVFCYLLLEKPLTNRVKSYVLSLRRPDEPNYQVT